MPRTSAIARLTIIHAPVTPKTVWTFLTVDTSDGVTGTGEATLNNRQQDLDAAFDRITPSAIGAPAIPQSAHLSPLPDDLPSAAVISGLDQALWDIAAQRADRPLASLLGQQRDTIQLYANINRRTEPRMPGAFADSAKLAAAQGFTAVKLAPFDEVTPANASMDMCAPGLARIAAARAALPDHCALYVDCHWRFTPAVADAIIPHLAERGVAWYECPIEETADAIPHLKHLRHRANANGMVLAGLETMIGVAAFQPFAEAGAYDVMMPDIKYIGGIDEMRRTADLLTRHGIVTSPHNPTGPICHAVSIALCAALPQTGRLELQLDETPLFDDLVAGACPSPAGGAVTVPTAAGHGLSLASAPLDRLRSVRKFVA
jgi:galactonate dehydratase